VAVDFSTRTATAGLGLTAPLPLSFLTAAGAVLSVVDGTSLNDPSVATGKAATSTYIAGATAGHQAAASVANPVDPNVIVVTGSDQLIDPGAGGYSIRFMAGVTADTLVLHAGGVDQVSGFDPGTDVLDLHSLFSSANVNVNGNFAALRDYVTIVDQGSDAIVMLDPAGHGGGDAIAALRGLGGTITGLDSLVSQNAVRFA